MPAARLIILLALFFAASVFAQKPNNETVYTAPFGTGGTWNLYQVVRVSETWAKACAHAQTMPDPLGGTELHGHLVTLGSMGENMFVYRIAAVPQVWIGLTDNERYGGHEAGAGRTKGWAWVTGEPFTFQNWNRSQPDDWTGRGLGEDAVCLSGRGLWGDDGIGEDGQNEAAFYYVVEWDVKAKIAVPGAVAWKPVLPAELPGPAGGAGFFGVRTKAGGQQFKHLALAMKCLLDESGQASVPTDWRAPWVQHANPLGRINDEGLFLGAERIAGARGGYNGTVSVMKGKIKIPKTGLYTFGVHADDGFALRIAGAKWKRVSGDGDIDPLDHSVIYQENASNHCDARGVVQLAAGTHAVELVHFICAEGGRIQLYAAPGEFANDGDTDAWRPVGWKARDKVAWPGIDAQGWKVEMTVAHPSDSTEKDTLSEALFQLETDKNLVVAKNVDAIHFADPECSTPGHFPHPVPFPNNTPADDDHFAMRATGTLVIPANGTYNIGFSGDDGASVRIAGQAWTQLARAPSREARMEDDHFSCFDITSAPDATTVAEISLLKGTYPIEVTYLENILFANLEVFAGPAGYPVRLLKKGGAEMVADHDGLELVP